VTSRDPCRWGVVCRHPAFSLETAVCAVLGLLLTFTFSLVVSRFGGRKQPLVEETNVIGTVYLSCGSSRT